MKRPGPHLSAVLAVLAIVLACYIVASLKPCTCVLGTPATAVDVPEDCERHGAVTP